MESEISTDGRTLEEHRKHLFACQERAVRLYNPEFNEEQIQERCKDLQRQIIEAESSVRFCTPKLYNIWAKKGNRRS